MNRRTFIAHAGKAAAGLAVCAVPFRARSSPRFDVIVKGGTILDGTGGPAWTADLGIAGDTITAIDEIPADQSAWVIDASGRYVCPGFVDIHSHSDMTLPAYPTADSRVRQGITTEITGNCGFSAAPLTGLDMATRTLLAQKTGMDPTWTDVGSYFAVLERIRFSANQALLLGQGTLRYGIVGPDDRQATPNEIKALIRALDEGMEQGAIGLSTGLEYPPGMFTASDEITELARVVARRDGLYTSHVRNEVAGLLDAIREAIDVGRRAGVRTEVSHLKVCGRANWGTQREAIGLIETARKDGIDVLADAYPYTAYSTKLTLLLPQWSLDGGAPAVVSRLRSTTDRGRIRSAVAEYVAGDPGGYDLIVISDVRTAGNKVCVGRNIADIARMWKVDPAEAVLRLVEDEQDAAWFVGHAMSPSNVEMVLAHPLVMVGSDGESIAPTGRAAETRPHPRSYGTCPRILGHYSRDRKALDLPAAVKKMTSMPADRARLRDRGRLARGKKADIVVFDAAAVEDRATFEDPHRYPAGIVHVIVNGVPVVRNGEHTGARPGRVLRH